MNQKKNSTFFKKRIRPIVSWLAGFFDADGSVFIYIRNSQNFFYNKACGIKFTLSQSDEVILNLIAHLVQQKKHLTLN